jgi:hypothetical protein
VLDFHRQGRDGCGDFIVQRVSPLLGDAREFCFHQLRTLDVLGKCNSPTHWTRVTCHVRLQVSLCQRFVAAHNLGGVVQLQLAVLISQKALNTCTDCFLVNRQHNNLVVGQKSVLDGP